MIFYQIIQVSFLRRRNRTLLFYLANEGLWRKKFFGAVRKFHRQPPVELHSRAGIVGCPVGALLLDFIIGAQVRQVFMLQIRQQRPGDFQGVHAVLFEGQAQIDRVFLYEAVVEKDIVAQKRQLFTKLQQLCDGCLRILSGRRHSVIDAGQFLDAGADGHARIHQGLIAIRDFSVHYFYRADFQDTVLGGVKAGGLQIQGDVVFYHNRMFSVLLYHSLPRILCPCLG